jgi:hypothetical protein
VIEEWRQIILDGIEFPYKVSNFGRVESLGRWVKTKDIYGVNRKRWHSGKILSPGFGLFGYPIVNLSKDGKSSSYKVATLVCTVFHGPRPEGKEVRHFPDQDPSNSNSDNLSWATREENMGDKLINGTDPRGERHHNVKLTEKQVLEIRILLKKGMHPISIAKKHMVHENTICDIKHERTWSWLKSRG